VHISVDCSLGSLYAGVYLACNGLLRKMFHAFRFSKKRHLGCSIAKLVRTRRKLSSTIINSHQEPVSGQACNPPDPHIFFLFAVEELYGTRYQSGPFSLINVGSGFHCLRSFFFFFSLGPSLHWTCMCAFTQDLRKWRACLLEALIGRC